MEGGQNDSRAPDAPAIVEERQEQSAPAAPPVRTLTLEGIARTCHEVNRIYCQSIGDDSQLTWSEAADWQKESALKGVNHALAGVTDEELHELWCADKLADGWIYGEVKDVVHKTHPCLVPYAELPTEQRRKDTFFGAIVGTLKDFLP
jgi:hypothetical protein